MGDMMRAWWLVLAVAACAPKIEVTALPSPVEEPEQAFITTLLSEDLRDPESARFRGWQGFDLSNGGRIVCGKVNATNMFGGFIGYSAFFVRLTGQTVQRMYIDDGSSSAGPAAIGCSMAARGRIGISEG
jgi:hypothetical protein